MSKNVIWLFLIMGCSSTNTAVNLDRNIASLDNDAETIIDTSLESNSADEELKFSEVGKTIASFIKKQSELRSQHASEINNHPEIHRDLPSKDENGNLISANEHNQYATRDVHRKTHGCYQAELSIEKDLSLKLKTKESELGIFKSGASYDAIVRYSNGHPGNRHDREPDARGMALKILPNHFLNIPIHHFAAEAIDQATILDILTINFPTFFVNDPVKYLKINQYFLESAEDYRGKLSTQVLQAESIFFSGMSSLEKKLAFLSNGSIIYSPLYQKYFSMVPSRLGKIGSGKAVKYSFVPAQCAGDKMSGKNFSEDLNKNWPVWSKRRDFSLISRTYYAAHDTPPFKDNYSYDYLRDNLKNRLTKKDFCFDLMFQVYLDQENTNIEDSTDIWLGDDKDKTDWLELLKSGINLDKNYYEKIEKKKYSPYIKAATLKLAQIDNEYPVKNTKTCEDISFSPWNGNIKMHKPLGIVSRMKRRVYNASRRARNLINNVPSRDAERK